MREIVVDKSFLDGAPTVHVRDLFASNRALIIETLFFELITTEARSQARCFSKVPVEPGSFSLIPNVGAFLRYELERREPCPPLDRHRVEGSYIFNAKLREGTYVPEGQVLQDMQEWEAQVRADTRTFLKRCQVVHQFFPELIGIEFRDFPAAVTAARSSIATDAARVRSIYAQLRADSPLPETLEPSEIGSDWAWFRRVQAHMLSALRMFGRYQCRIPDPPTDGVLRSAEHSMHDVEYVLVASLAGAIATGDAEVEEDFRLLCPAGLVVKPSHNGATGIPAAT